MVKKGILRKNTRIYLSNGVTLKLLKGTEVHLHDYNKIVFKMNEEGYLRGVAISKVAPSKYEADIWGRHYNIEFPKGNDKVPYPLSLL